MQTSAELVQSITHDVLAVPENTEQPGVGEKIGPRVRTSSCQGWSCSLHCDTLTPPSGRTKTCILLLLVAPYSNVKCKNTESVF